MKVLLLILVITIQTLMITNLCERLGRRSAQMLDYQRERNDCQMREMLRHK